MTKNVPWKTIQRSPGNLGCEGALVKVNGEWYVLTLRIGSPKDGRWYATREDGSRWRISVGRATEWVDKYDWSRDTVWVGRTAKQKPAPHKEAREFWQKLWEEGKDGAMTTRDRISTRRMETAERRKAWGF